uniref:Uncharacterized protein n=1 Tax=Onchocerca volvulus TaxID=6282 RepID=A0A8R1TZC4_ONCVO
MLDYHKCFPMRMLYAYGAAMPVHYKIPVVQTTRSAAAATIITTANVTNGPVIANTAGLLIDYHEQINSLMKSIATIYARFLYCVCS